MQIRSDATESRQLTRVCTVCLNYRKLIVKWNSFQSPFRTLFPAYTQRQSTTVLSVLLLNKVIYSKISRTQTPMARLPWLIRTRFWDPTKFFRELKKTNIRIMMFFFIYFIMKLYGREIRRQSAWICDECFHLGLSGLTDIAGNVLGTIDGDWIIKTHAF